MSMKCILCMPDPIHIRPNNDDFIHFDKNYYHRGIPLKKHERIILVLYRDKRRVLEFFQTMPVGLVAVHKEIDLHNLYTSYSEGAVTPGRSFMYTSSWRSPWKKRPFGWEARFEKQLLQGWSLALSLCLITHIWRLTVTQISDNKIQCKTKLYIKFR